MASDTAGSDLSSVVYPQGQVESFRTLSVGLALTATTAISYCFAQRAYHVDLFSRRGLSSINITKGLLLLLFVDSWAFVFLSGILVNGIGMSLSPTTCTLGVFSCIIFYCISKLLTYLFLLEKVYIVWPSPGGRWSSISYRIGFCALLGFVVVLIMMVIGRIAYLTEDRQCIIGLQKASSMATLLVDISLNILLTSLFLWPLWRSKLLSPNIRRVASRTLVASCASLTISATNLTILTILHGQELGWICIASCTTDVVINALVLFWLTRPGEDKDEPTSNGGHASNHRCENVKGGAVQMHRISVNPGMHGSRHTGSFTGTSSLNGMTKISTGLETSAAPEDVPRAPLKVNFSGYPHMGVYNGSQPRTRGGPALSTDDKMAASEAIFTASSFVQAQDELPSSFKDQKRHSAGFVYEKKVTTGSKISGRDSPTNFLSRFIGKRSPADGGKRNFGGTPGAVGGRRRPRSDDDVGVRITVTTTQEGDNDLNIIDIEAGDSNGSSEDQSKNPT